MSTWSSTFRSAVARGYDHGYAAFAADIEEKRQHRLLARISEEHLLIQTPSRP